MRLLKVLAAVVAIAAVAVVALRLAFPLPDISDRPETAVVAPDPDAPLARAAAERAAREPGLSGVLPLLDGTDALVSRLELIRLAERSIDAQYYIWQDDISGILLLGALREAAARGVRVRLLLDDNGVPGMDGHLAALNALDGFEVRLFNPSTVRAPKMLGYAFDFFRMNRRMHNKSFIADGVVAVIGGRNIGDDYFQIGAEFYVDMDVLGVGAVVADTRAVFEQYWNAGSSFALETIVAGPGDMPAFEARLAEVAGGGEVAALVPEFRGSAARLAEGAAELEWTRVQVVADDPVKGQGVAEREDLMITRLTDILGGVERRLDLVSAYFIPGRIGTETFAELAAAGREVNILTNALDTTDVLLVHAGYTKYRRDLLEAGADLYEMKLRGGSAPDAARGTGPFGLSGASLHAKTFAIDDERIFIGSFNFDPRSALLNCEMGFLIDSPTLARELAASFEASIPAISYKPALTPDGDMVWTETIEGGDPVLYQKEPGASWLQQAMLAVIGTLPIEWML
jgi:putative cardiolipin synthase